MYGDAEIDEWSPNPADWKPGPLAQRIVRLLNEDEEKRHAFVPDHIAVIVDDEEDMIIRQIESISSDGMDAYVCDEDHRLCEDVSLAAILYVTDTWEDAEEWVQGVQKTEQLKTKRRELERAQAFVKGGRMES